MSTTLQIKATVYCTKDAISRVTLHPIAHDFQWEIVALDAHPINPKLYHDIDAWMNAYRSRSSSRFPVSLSPLSDYTKRTLDAISLIPFGETLSYTELAALLGNPKGARSAGQACGRNPIPLLIPCHRVVTSQGTLGGFSEGLEIKRRLLQFERSDEQT